MQQRLCYSFSRWPLAASALLDASFRVTHLGVEGWMIVIRSAGKKITSGLPTPYSATALQSRETRYAMATMNRVGMRRAARDLAQWLVVHEAESSEILIEDHLATCRVCEKLRRPLSNLTGPAGYSSLLTRALSLAQREDPALGGVRVTPAGTLEGLSGEAADASTTLVAHLIELLTTFVGESLTLRLLHDIWPDLPASEPYSGEKTGHE